MVSYFDQPNKRISPEEIFNYGGRYLILAEAAEKGIQSQLLLRTKPSGKKAVYIRFQKGKQYQWISPQRGYFNSKQSCELALFKDLTYQVLQSSNFPIPQFQKISQPEEIKKIRLAFPLVLKPINQTRGRGVLINIGDKKELEKSAKELFKKYRGLIAEELIAGNDYRLLVLDNKLLGAVKRIPPEVTGDGINTIAQLIKKSNQDQRKKQIKKPERFLKIIKPDAEVALCLLKQGLDLNSTPEKGRKIQIRQNANFSTGGITYDVTDQIHPKNIELAKNAIRALGLKFGGIDIISPDISKPIEPNNGKIIEVNGIPAIWIHHFPNYGKPRNIAGEIIDYLFNKNN